MRARCPSLDGRVFRAADEVPGGEVGTQTRFEYHQRDDLVWARYAGGRVRLGHLVGTRRGDELDFRYVQVNDEGTTASGHCRSRLTLLQDGRIRMDESWEWESRSGSGTSVVEEVA